ncbi:MAG: hypothetical protein KDA55_10670 [Planctomycetales bacterium]|nr:hypothetical protein [Planctomycetales bacterium]
MATLVASVVPVCWCQFGSAIFQIGWPKIRSEYNPTSLSENGSVSSESVENEVAIAIDYRLNGLCKLFGPLGFLAGFSAGQKVHLGTDPFGANKFEPINVGIAYDPDCAYVLVFERGTLPNILDLVCNSRAFSVLKVVDRDVSNGDIRTDLDLSDLAGDINGIVGRLNRRVSSIQGTLQEPHRPSAQKKSGDPGNRHDPLRPTVSEKERVILGRMFAADCFNWCDFGDNRFRFYGGPFIGLLLSGTWF